MKTSIKITIKLLALFVFFAINSCSSFFDLTDPRLEKERDAYYAVIEAHTMKQIWMYDFFALYSKNYSKELFSYEPTYEELNKLLSQFKQVIEYGDEVEKAATLIRLAQDSIENTLQTDKLKSIEGAVDAFMEFFTEGAVEGEKMRKRIITIASHLDENDRANLFENLDPNLKGDAASASEFWENLQNGELDTSAPQIHNYFYHYNLESSNYASLTQDLSLTPNQAAFKDGVLLLEKGSNCMIETFKTATPLGETMDMFDKAKEFEENMEKITTMKKTTVEEVVSSSVSQKLESTEEDDDELDFNNLGKALGKSTEMLNQISKFMNNTEQVNSTTSTIGGLKIENSTGNVVPELIMAERDTEDGTYPKIMLAWGAYVNQLKQSILALPKGSWDVVVVDKNGKSAKTDGMSIMPQQFSQVDFSHFGYHTDTTSTVEEVDPDSLYITVTPNPIVASLNQEVSLSLKVVGQLPSRYRVDWQFGDGTPTQIVTNNINVSHKFVKEGEYSIKVYFYDETTTSRKDTKTSAKAQIGNILAQLTNCEYLSVYFKSNWMGKNNEMLGAYSFSIGTRADTQVQWSGRNFSVNFDITIGKERNKANITGQVSDAGFEVLSLNGTYDYYYIDTKYASERHYSISCINIGYAPDYYPKKNYIKYRLIGSDLKDHVLGASYDFEIESTKPLLDTGNPELLIQFGDIQ
jgi:hypothetical protein